MKKNILIPLLVIFAVVMLQSCKKNIFGFYKDTKIEGYVTDSLTGEPIENVKMEIKLQEFEGNVPVYIDTGLVTYTDANGYYEFNYKNIEGINKLIPTHEDYVFVGNYPHVAVGLKLNEINITMIKRGKVKIEGDVFCRENEPIWLENVKISLLKREIGSINYPTTTGVETYTDENGKFYLEYEGDENYEFFLKPEKDGYYCGNCSESDDYGTGENKDPGYIIKRSFMMEKEN